MIEESFEVRNVCMAIAPVLKNAVTSGNYRDMSSVFHGAALASIAVGKQNDADDYQTIADVMRALEYADINGIDAIIEKARSANVDA